MPTTSPWKSIARNAFSLTIADVASKGATGIIAIVLARMIGPDLFGKYAAASAVTGLFTLITQLGFEQQFTRMAGRDHSRTEAALGLNMTVVAGSVVVALAALTVFLVIGFYPADVALLILLLTLTAFVSRFHLPFRYLCLVLQKSHVTAAIQGAATAVMFVGTIAVLKMGMSLPTVLAFQLAVSAVALGAWIAWMKTASGVRLKLGGTRADISMFVRWSASFALSNLLWIAYFNIDTFILSLMRSDREVGLYAGVYRIVGINYVFGYALANTFTPALFRTHTEGPAAFGDTCRRLMKAMAVISVAAGVGLYVLSGPLVSLLIGREYVDGVPIAQVLSIAVFFRMLNFGLSEILTAGGNQATRVILEIVMLAGNVGLNLALIPRYGGLGSAVATVAAEAFLTVGAFTMWRRRAAREARAS